MKFKHLFTAISLITLSYSVTAQKYVAQKNSVGFNINSLSYSGRFSAGRSLPDNSALAASIYYRRIVYDRTYIRAELFGGRMRADNTEAKSQVVKPTGAFQTEMAELSIKGEYEFIDLRLHKATPYATAGVGAYTLFDYSSSAGAKSGSDLFGFVVPAGVGAKYKVNDRIKLLAEGTVRFFPKNLDGRTGSDINNPNKYYSLGIGFIYELSPANRLW